MRKSLRTLARALVVPLLMVMLGACGSNNGGEPETGASIAGAGAQGDAYCSTLKDVGERTFTLDYFALDSAADFTDLPINISELKTSAPVEVKAAWVVLGDEYDRFAELMDDADLSIDELLYWDDNGKLPANVQQKQFAQFFRKLMALDHTKVAKAAHTIVAHARAKCGIDLDPE